MLFAAFCLQNLHIALTDVCNISVTAANLCCCFFCQICCSALNRRYIFTFESVHLSCHSSENIVHMPQQYLRRLSVTKATRLGQNKRLLNAASSAHLCRVMLNMFGWAYLFKWSNYKSHLEVLNKIQAPGGGGGVLDSQ